MAFKLASLKFRPGMVRDDTEYSAEGTWVDGDKVRFYRGYAEKLGGWQKMFDSQVSGKCRGLFAWADNAGLRWLMAGTHTGLYVTDTDTLHDITGLGRIRSICYGDSKWLAVGRRQPHGARERTKGPAGILVRVGTARGRAVLGAVNAERDADRVREGGDSVTGHAEDVAAHGG